jgi:predicted dehydrogenase
MRLLTLALLILPALASAEPLRLAIAGLVHGHAAGFLRSAQGKDVAIVGIFDPDPELHKSYAARFKLDPKIFYSDLNAMLDAVKPEAVAAFSSTFDHPVIVEAAARRRLPVMMEKPLAVSMDHARRIQRAAAQSGIPVIVNYETTWYRSHAAIFKTLKQDSTFGPIRKIVAMDGHQGPREIGVGPEFFNWLTDPVKNGAGALFDFGCYGANLITWLLDNQRPLSVTAVTQRFKPAIYPRVDDEANVLVEYKDTIGIIQGSWNWPYSRKDLEVYAHAVGGNTLRLLTPGTRTELTPALDPLPADQSDPVAYLSVVARGRLKPAGLSSLENNMIVTEILEAARESARTGRAIRLSPR